MAALYFGIEMDLSNAKLLKSMFVRRKQELRWIYLVAAFPFIAFAIAGWEYGAFFLYITPAVICLIQYFYPTVIGWLFFFSIFCVGTAAYLWLLLTDVVKLFAGKRPSALLDCDDSIVFILLVILLSAISYGLFKIRPKKVTRD